MTAADGFERAAFSFYGHQNAVFVCALSLPFGLALASSTEHRWRKIVVGSAFVLQISGVFIAGFRSMWLQSAVLLTAILIRFLGFARGLALVAILGFTTYPLLPHSVEQRVGSLIRTLQGQPDDSSGQDRWTRVKDAAEVTIQNPLGEGWAGSGWVHSDFLQVAANLGIAAGVVFFGSYVAALHRLWRRLVWFRTEGTDSVFTFALFLSFLTMGWILATEPMIVLPQTVLPVWLVWTLVELELRQPTDRPWLPACKID